MLSTISTLSSPSRCARPCPRASRLLLVGPGATGSQETDQNFPHFGDQRRRVSRRVPMAGNAVVTYFFLPTMHFFFFFPFVVIVGLKTRYFSLSCWSNGDFESTFNLRSKLPVLAFVVHVRAYLPTPCD